MKTTTFANRHIGIGEKELPLMLKKIGVSSLDELIEKTTCQYPVKRTFETGSCHDGT